MWRASCDRRTRIRVKNIAILLKAELLANQQQLNLDAYKRYARELKLDVRGAKSFEEFATAIDAELSRLKLPVPAAG